MDPAQYPTIKIPNIDPKLPDDTYTLKFRVCDLVKLASEGIDLLTVTEVKGIEALTRTVKVICAGIAHQKQLDPEEMYSRIDMLMLPDLAEAIRLAVSKVPAQPKTAPVSNAPIQ